MNPIVLCFADGTTFFVGLAIVLVGEALLFGLNRRALRSLVSLVVVVGMIMVAISATPLPGWLYAVWAIPAILGLLLCGREKTPKKLRISVFLALLATTAGLYAWEIPYHRVPTVTITDDTTIYVLGDSISAGTGSGSGVRCWPEVLSEKISIEVVNLASDGSRIGVAARQAEGVARPRSLVIVEIGGIDMLEGVDARLYHEKIDALVASLRADNHQVLIVEFPLFPTKNGYGRAQRKIAADHGATLLPKRCFTKVLGTTEGTLDGLHLSQIGHDTMAAIMARVIRKD